MEYSADSLNADEIIYGLKSKIIGRNIKYLNSVDSTNNYAKKIAMDNGYKEGTVVIAESQTAGRGRLGRVWNSAASKGIWMSIILRPNILPEDLQIITIAASVAVVTAIKSVTGIETGIKWPNDIILDGKKVCGILTEMVSEQMSVKFLIVGIGINVNHDGEDFPEDLKDIAISLKSYVCQGQKHPKMFLHNEGFKRSEMIKAVLFELENVYDKINNGYMKEIIDIWKQYSVTLGKEVSITYGDVSHQGIARDVSPEGKLIVSCTDGLKREFLSGEISIRGILGYT